MASRPSPGVPYRLDEDLSPEEIAQLAYGNPAEGPRVWGTNRQVVNKSTGKIPKGTTVIIPAVPGPLIVEGKDPGAATIVIGDVEIEATSIRIVRAMDTCADAWIADIPWIPGADPALDAATKPYGYQHASAYLCNKLQVNGRLYTVEPRLTNSGSVKQLTGYSFTIDAVDSHCLPPYERGSVTFEKVANEFARQIGINVIVQTDTGGPFARVTAHESDTLFGHLSKLANERGFLVSCTPQGDFLIFRANTDGQPVGQLVEGQPGVIEWKATFDGRKRFNLYKCISAGTVGGAQDLIWANGIPYGTSSQTKTPPMTVTETDPAIPVSRVMVFRADDTTPGNQKDAARWKKNRQFIDALTFDLPVDGWYAPNGELWEPNTLVTVVSPTLGIPKGFTFLIRQVEFLLAAQRTATLSLVPPEAFTGKDIGQIWS